jgi:coenzyme F420-reducing hydrogenase beta subunit
MDSTFQTLTVRNDLGKEMVNVALKSGRLEVSGEHFKAPSDKGNEK